MNEMKHPPGRDFVRPVAQEPFGSLIVWDGISGFVKRRRRTIFATTLVVFAIGFGALLLAPWSFRATAVVAINVNPAIPENPQIHTPTPQAERMQREIQGLQSRALAAKVIDKLSLEREPEFNPDLHGPGIVERLAGTVTSLVTMFGKGHAPSEGEVEDLRRGATVDLFMEKLTVVPVLTADLIQITFASRDPRIAYRVANAVADTYIESAASARSTALQKAADALQERISAVKDELRDLPVGAGALNTIERQLEARRTLLQAYIAKLGELLLLKAAIEPRIIVQSRAVFPMKRAGIPLALSIPFLIAAGLVMGVGVGIVQETRQRAIGSATQLQTLFGLQILGGISSAEGGALGPDSKRIERACDRIALELLMAHPTGRAVTIAVTGASQNEAKSAICVGVARALARAQHRTLVVDAGAIPSSYQAKLAAQAKAPPGVVENASVADVQSSFEIRRDSSTGLDCLLVRLSRDSGAAAYEAAAKAIAEAAPRYGFVVLDLPPVGENPEARFLSRFAELAVIVVRRDIDGRDALQSTIDRLEADGARIVGAVLTKGKFERSILGWAADRLRFRA